MWYHKFEQMLEGAHKMEKLSRMQQRVYDYIAESIAEHGYAPSVREVGEALGLKSPSTVHFHIKHLQEMGLIEKSAGKGRAITLKKQLQAVPVAPQPAEIDELAPRRRQVPILGNVAAGNPILAQECIEDYLTFDTGGSASCRTTLSSSTARTSRRTGRSWSRCLVTRRRSKRSSARAARSGSCPRTPTTSPSTAARARSWAGSWQSSGSIE